MNYKNDFLHGIRDGFPIGLGYFAVSFSLGITAKNIGIKPFQAFLLGLLNNASAGQYAGLALMAADAAYIEIAVMIFIANARYLLMSCALSQKFSQKTPFFHRLLIGFDVTDELFGIAIAYPGYIVPAYMYGAFSMALPGWSLGAPVAIIVGDILPARVMCALSVAIYGMFLAVIIPPARQNRVVLGAVLASFILSYFSTVVPFTAALSSGTRTILLTVIIASAAALLFPVHDDADADISGAEHDSSDKEGRS